MYKQYAHYTQILDFLKSEYQGYQISLEEIPTNFLEGTKAALAIFDISSSETTLTANVRMIRVRI